MLPNKFKTFRVQKNLSLEEAADLFGISHTYWRRIENGTLLPDQIKMYSNAVDLCNYDMSKISKKIISPSDFMDIKKYGLNKKQFEEITGFKFSTWRNMIKDPGRITKKWSVLIIGAVYAILQGKAEEAKPKAKETSVTVISEPVITDHRHTFEMIRTEVDENNKAWFCLSDICKQVGYTNVTAASELVGRHALTKRKVIDALGRQQETSFVTESGMYQFLLRCHLPKAEAFSNWVTEVVLPSINKTGQYSTSQEQNFGPGIKELAQLIGLKNADIESQVNQIKLIAAESSELVAKQQQQIEELKQAVQNIDQEEITAIVHDRFIKGVQDMGAALADLKSLVNLIVRTAKSILEKRPFDKMAYMCSHQQRVWPMVHSAAEPRVHNIDAYMTVEQVQYAIEGAQRILAKLGYDGPHQQSFF